MMMLIFLFGQLMTPTFERASADRTEQLQHLPRFLSVKLGLFFPASSEHLYYVNKLALHTGLRGEMTRE